MLSRVISRVILIANTLYIGWKSIVFVVLENCFDTTTESSSWIWICCLLFLHENSCARLIVPLQITAIELKDVSQRTKKDSALMESTCFPAKNKDNLKETLLSKVNDSTASMISKDKNVSTRYGTILPHFFLFIYDVFLVCVMH